MRSGRTHSARVPRPGGSHYAIAHSRHEHAMKSSASKTLWYTTLAAGAAAVPSVHGAIRYTDVVPDVTGGTVSWDLDNGGTIDFRLEVAVVNGMEKSNLVPVTAGNADGIALFNTNADKMQAGETIGPSTQFSNATETKTLYDEANPGNFDWNVGARGFLGLRVNLGGTTHYGWADVGINRVGADSFNHTLYGYAYEDTPGMEIAAGAIPEPSTAALLVAGAAGVASMRRRRQV
jgi:hypothetical protein